MNAPIGFADLSTQNARIRPELEKAIGQVFDGSDFVLGRAVAEFEEDFARYCGVREAIGVSSGTDALHLALLAAGVGPGDEVITTAFTFIGTVAAIRYTGAQPVLVDISRDSFTIDANKIEAAITRRTRAIVPVHLYGQAADMEPILEIARRHELAVIEDACQAHGALYRGKKVGSFGQAGCFSFYPSKNLGACGEGGLVVTSNTEMARQIRLLRNWGQIERYKHSGEGFGRRMQGLQAAILRVKLRHLDEWNATRRANATRYDNALRLSRLIAPRHMNYGRHVYHVYAVRTAQRQRAIEAFASLGIEARVHYPYAISQLSQLGCIGASGFGFPEAEAAAREVLSIPVHPELTADQLEHIVSAFGAVSAELHSELEPQ